MERITTKALADAFIEEQIKEIRAQVGERKVLLALSGGVASSVVAALLIKAIGKQLTCHHSRGKYHGCYDCCYRRNSVSFAPYDLQPHHT